MESHLKEVKSEPAKKNFVFGPNDLDTEAKHIFRFHVFVADGVEFKQLLDPSAWLHIASRLRPMSRISVTSETNRYIGELVVISNGQNWAKVEEVFYREFGELESPDSNGQYEVKWISNRYKFGVRRISDGEWMIKDLPDMAAANVALATFSLEVKSS